MSTILKTNLIKEQPITIFNRIDSSIIKRVCKYVSKSKCFNLELQIWGSVRDQIIKHDLIFHIKIIWFLINFVAPLFGTMMIWKFWWFHNSKFRWYIYLFTFLLINVLVCPFCVAPLQVQCAKNLFSFKLSKRLQYKYAI